MEGWFNIKKSTNVILHIKRLKKKTNHDVTIDAEKAFEKVEYPLMIIKSQKNKI